jgi:hypothetical protein
MINGSRLTQHTFAVGKYNVCVEARNAISGKSNCTMLEIKEKIGSIRVGNPTAIAGDNTTINITISKGSGYNCSVDFGDTNVTNLDDKQLPVATGHVIHTYAKPGKYNVRVACKNGLQPDPPPQTMPIEVQENITDLTFKSEGAQKGQPVRVRLGTKGVKDGYGLKYNCTSNPPLQPGKSIDMTACDNKPQCDSKIMTGVAVRGYVLTCTVTNKLGTITKSTNFTIDSPITNPNFTVIQVCDPVSNPPTLNAYYIMVPSCVVFRGGMESGSSAFVRVDYGDGTTPGEVRMPALQPWPKNRYENFNHTYTKSGEFHAKAEIGNGDGTFPWNYTIKAFKRMNISCVDKGPQKAGLVVIKFQTDDGTTPPSTTFTMDFGDGTKQGKKPFTLATPVSHTYHQGNTYTIKAVFTNPVDYVSTNCTIEVIEPITDPKVFFQPLNAAVGGNVSILAQVSRGSDMKATYSWGYPPPGANVTVGCKCNVG